MLVFRASAVCLSYTVSFFDTNKVIIQEKKRKISGDRRLLQHKNYVNHWPSHLHLQWNDYIDSYNNTFLEKFDFLE